MNKVQIKIGEWFKLGDKIIKVYDIVGDLILAHVMSFDNGEYTELHQWAIHRSYFKRAKEYKPYEEES